MNNKLIPEFKDSLFDNIIETAGEMLEVGIDSILEDGIFKKIPIVGTLIGLCKIGANLHDRNLLKQTCIFLNEFHNGTLIEDKYIAYKSTIENNSKKCEEELGRVLLLLNNTIDSEKAIMLAKAYKSYINEFINWATFIEYSEVINRLFLEDIRILKEMYNNSHDCHVSGVQWYQLNRLEDLGFMLVQDEQRDYKKYTMSDNTCVWSYIKVHIKGFGWNFYKYAMK